MSKQNKKAAKSSFVSYKFNAPVKSEGQWVASYEDDKGQIVCAAGEKTKGECHRVIEFRLKAVRKQDKKAFELAIEKALKAKKSKGWSIKRHLDHAKDECQCTKCGEIKSFDEFYNDRTNKAGVQNFCKECIKDYNQKKRAAKKAA